MKKELEALMEDKREQEEELLRKKRARVDKWGPRVVAIAGLYMAWFCYSLLEKEHSKHRLTPLTSPHTCIQVEYLSSGSELGSAERFPGDLVSQLICDYDGDKKADVTTSKFFTRWYAEANMPSRDSTLEEATYFTHAIENRPNW